MSGTDLTRKCVKGFIGLSHLWADLPQRFVYRAIEKVWSCCVLLASHFIGSFNLFLIFQSLSHLEFQPFANQSGQHQIHTGSGAVSIGPARSTTDCCKLGPKLVEILPRKLGTLHRSGSWKASVREWRDVSPPAPWIEERSIEGDMIGCLECLL